MFAVQPLSYLELLLLHITHNFSIFVKLSVLSKPFTALISMKMKRHNCDSFIFPDIKEESPGNYTFKNVVFFI